MWIIYSDDQSSHEAMLKKNISVYIYNRDLQIFATAICKVRKAKTYPLQS